jgi:hypothetical protein
VNTARCSGVVGYEEPSLFRFAERGAIGRSTAPAARLRGGSSLCSLLDGVDAVVAGAALIDAARKPGDVPASLGDECPSLAVRVTARERK